MYNKRLWIIIGLVLLGLLIIFLSRSSNLNDTPPVTPAYPPKGTPVSDTCIDCARYQKVADGRGGYTVINSGPDSSCCETSHPSPRAVIDTTRRGNDGQVKDGKGKKILDRIDKPGNWESPQKGAQTNTLLPTTGKKN